MSATNLARAHPAHNHHRPLSARRLRWAGASAMLGGLLAVVLTLPFALTWLALGATLWRRPPEPAANGEH